jgi:hypothetical protein
MRLRPWAMVSVVASTLAATSNSASADPVDETLKGANLWGGPFALDCSRPAAPRNWVATFGGAAPRFTLTFERGPGASPHVEVIEEAHKLPDGAIDLKVESQANYAQIERVLAVGQKPDAFRTMRLESTISGDVRLIIDRGAAVTDGIATPWYVRCRP